MKNKKLRVAMFCSNEWPTPPPENTFYAPLWIAYFVAEGMTKRGHNVFYFGSEKSKISGNLITLGMPALKFNKILKPYIPCMNEKVVNFYEQMMIGEIYRMSLQNKFDIIHIHPYRRAVQYAAITNTPTVFTLHDPVDGFNKYMIEQTLKQPNTYMVSISNSQRKTSPKLNYVSTVYNGLNIKKYKFNGRPENSLVAAGRFVPEKGIDIAVKVAKKARAKLKLAGGLPEGKYWEKEIKPYLGMDIKYVGMLRYYQMGDFYGQGKALLYPLRWEEPFGLVVIEAMACGTPVIAFKHGSMPELIKNGKNGFLVNTIPEMVRAVKKINTINRKDCREWVEKHFTTDNMVEGYEAAYYKILQNKKYNC